MTKPTPSPRIAVLRWPPRARNKARFRNIVSLVLCEKVIYEREPTNPYHSNAIVMRNQYNGWIGYVDRDSADYLAPFMDAGWFFTAEVIRIRPPVGPHRIEKDAIAILFEPILPTSTKQKEKRHVEHTA